LRTAGTEPLIGLVLIRRKLPRIYGARHQQGIDAAHLSAGLIGIWSGTGSNP
jgi:hypothetical protein